MKIVSGSNGNIDSPSPLLIIGVLIVSAYQSHQGCTLAASICTSYSNRAGSPIRSAGTPKCGNTFSQFLQGYRHVWRSLFVWCVWPFHPGIILMVSNEMPCVSKKSVLPMPRGSIARPRTCEQQIEPFDQGLEKVLIQGQCRSRRNLPQSRYKHICAPPLSSPLPYLLEY
jgi:hypothetical protein